MNKMTIRVIDIPMPLKQFLMAQNRLALLYNVLDDHYCSDECEICEDVAKELKEVKEQLKGFKENGFIDQQGNWI